MEILLVMYYGQKKFVNHSRHLVCDSADSNGDLGV
jgi:hypothetical protein